MFIVSTTTSPRNFSHQVPKIYIFTLLWRLRTAHHLSLSRLTYSGVVSSFWLFGSLGPAKMAEAVVIGAVAGAAAQQVWELLKKLAAAPSKFEQQYKRLEMQWGSLRLMLDKQKSSVTVAKDLRREIKRGEVLIRKCAQVRCWNLLNQAIYSKRLEELEKTIQGFIGTETLRGVQELISSLNEMNCNLEKLVGGLPPLPEVFGIEEPLREVKGRLRTHRVVGVCGIGGCGKTTLANKLCREADIEDGYEKLIFQSVSRSPDLEKICRRLFEKFQVNVGTFANQRDAINELASYLRGRTEKVLIVLDDVWSDDEGIIRDLVSAIKGAESSKILITSRTELDGVCDWCHTMNLLSEDDARKLFEHHAFNAVNPERSWKPNKDLIDKIVRGCKFHPLTLKVIGGSLAKRDEREWQGTADRLKQTGGIFEGRSDNEIFKRLSISLQLLTEGERECFLDMGSFPEDQTIPASAIIDMWTETRHLDENDAYVILRELGRRNLLKLVDRKCGDAGDPDGSFSSLSVTQHDVLRELAIHKSKVESPITRLIMENREDNIPETWTREKDRTIHAKLVSINTGKMKSSDWPDLDLPNAEVLILNFSATSYCLPPFLQSMKNLKVLLVANHGSNRAELDGLSLLSYLNKLKRVMFRKISLPAEPLHMVEEGSRLWSRVWKFVKSVISITMGASPEPPQDLHKLSLVLCDVCHLLHIPSLFLSVRDLEIDYCTDLGELPDTICHISSLEKLSITNFPDLLRLPESIDKLSKLKVLRLQACGTLKCLPQSISQLSELRFLDISYCSSLGAFPEGMEILRRLEKIDMRSCSGIEELPPPLVQMECLTKVICDEDGSSLWISCGFDPSKLDVRREEVDLRFLHG
ncbi:putative disease resistance protein [Nymphaea thermarum]|nr:putative disease resistance protein [Nymphaea thermarum]